MKKKRWTVVVAQWSLTMPEVRGSIPVVGKFLIEHCLLSTVLKGRRYRKRGREFFKKKRKDKTKYKLSGSR